jgi:CubicO group peptidase (beta-lactamase class C family)
MHMTVMDRVIPDVDALVEEVYGKSALPGLAVGIVRDGELVYSRGIGEANIARHIPVTADTTFRIGSISKTMTAIGIMQLWEQGNFDLDEPVNRYLRTYKVLHLDPNAPPVTFRHLLTHTAGIGEVRAWGDLAQPIGGLAVKEGEKILPLGEYYKGRLTPEVYPGTRWAYANHGFATLGQLVEDISGEPFADYMRRHLFEPLGMEHTDFLRTERVRDTLAIGYAQTRRGLKPLPYQDIAIGAAGSVFSSVSDMAKYVAALLKNDSTLLKPETLTRMLTQQYTPDPRLPGMGFAFLLDDIGGQRIPWHDGGWPGFISSMYFAPEAGIGVLAFTNSSSQAPHTLAARLMAKLLNAPDPNEPLKDILPTPGLWRDLVGYYGPEPGLNTSFRALSAGAEMEVYVADDQLMVRPLIGPASMRKGIRLQAADPNDPLVFQISISGMALKAVFQRDRFGQVRKLQLAMPGFTFVKRPYWQSFRSKFDLLKWGGVALFAWATLRRWRKA